MTPLAAAKVQLRESGLTWRDVGGEIVALDLISSRYFSTNKTGACLWRALVNPVTRSELAQIIQDEFQIPEQVAATDVRKFLETLNANGFLVASE